MIRLHNILANVTPTQIANAIQRLYQPGQQDELEAAVEKFYPMLRSMTPRETEFILEISVGSDVDQVGNFDIHFLRVGDPMRHSGAFSPREVWLGAEVPAAMAESMPHDEIAGHAIWEMTFYGWDDIDEFREEIRSRIADMGSGDSVEGGQTAAG